jgi:SOS response regulatory protein OraA/RecX
VLAVPVASASEDEVDGEYSRTSTERAKRAEAQQDSFSRSSDERAARKSRGSSFGSGAKSSFRSGGGSSLSSASSPSEYTRSSDARAAGKSFGKPAKARRGGFAPAPVVDEDGYTRSSSRYAPVAKPVAAPSATAPAAQAEQTRPEDVAAVSSVPVVRASSLLASRAVSRGTGSAVEPASRSKSRTAAAAADAFPSAGAPSVSSALAGAPPAPSTPTVPAAPLTGKIGFVADIENTFDADAFDLDDDDEPFVAPSSSVPPPGSPQTVQPTRNKGPSLKARAVDLLSRREHSEQEMRRKLARHAEDPTQIDPVIASLKKEGWLSAERFTQSLVHRRAPGRGMSRVVQELRQHGVDPDQIAEVKESLQATELDRARDVWERRYGTPPTDANARAKQTRFLMSRGFSYDVIKRVLAGGGDAFDDE